MALNSPGLDAAVFGNGASGAVIGCQNSAVVRSTPARYVSEPNVTTSGTMWIPAAAATAGSRSDAESVTKAMRATVPSSGAVPDPDDTGPLPASEARARA